MYRLLPLCVVLGLAALPARAETQQLTLTPANTRAELHAKSALTDVDGQFEQVSGKLNYDLSTQACHVDLTMDVNSLKVGSAVLRSLMLSGLMLDGDTHPTMRYVGHCQPKIVKGQVKTYLVGDLTMRGQTHPVTFAVTMAFKGNTLTRIVSDATFDQRQWGLSTLLHSVDPMVKTQTVIDVGK
ncbi:polyisoprenoid-binding protein YceI [Endobacter medicaginis]|jgi:polyisoprenoid-binding protein YceI|uniref:Polyisoprenoid-binding protein YceI n=1 Tax=Endobacter medicaginis TaxID=1181271 RepID=A0A839V441_9PROT|nr:YceI family protein [Endobacter medicaginis]MBB3174241.1 polyisoprenoid-binding protein YceI [Endobacter medicaginis]MCX5474285.1 YceI family protein [Endobacter medicaginis]NVN29075.1 YceI family protein [Endobacter medicaginis]